MGGWVRGGSSGRFPRRAGAGFYPLRLSALALLIVQCVDSSPRIEDAVSPAAPDVAEETDIVAPGSDVTPWDKVAPEADVWEPPATEATVAGFDLFARPVQGPFPSARYLKADSESPSGWRVRSDRDEYSNVATDEFFNMFKDFHDAWLTLDGYGPYGWSTTPLSGAAPVGFAQPAILEMEAPRPVRLFLWDGETIQDELPVRAMVRESEAHPSRARRSSLNVLPLRPLPDGARYVVVVTTELTDAQGQPIGPDVQFQLIAGTHPLPDPGQASGLFAPEEIVALAAERERLAPLFDALDSHGLSRESVAVAWSGVVAPARAELLAVAERFRDEEQTRPVSYSLDPHPDQANHPYKPYVVRPGEEGFDSRISGAAFYVRGHFERRDYRDKEHFGGAFRLDDQGVPVEQSRGEMGFYLVIPEDPAEGPYPLALALHGVDSRKGSMRGTCSGLAAAGIACLAYDLPEHGDSGPTGGPAFLDVMNPLAVRDNFRQAGIDLLSAVQLATRWATDGLDLGQVGGVASDPVVIGFNAEPLLMVGHSLGAMVGHIGMGLAPQPAAGVFVVGGGGIFHFFETFLETFGFSGLLPSGLVHAVDIIAGHLLAAGDPINYAPLIRHSLAPAASSPRAILLMQVIGDETMPDACLEASAVALGLDIVGPVARSVVGLASSEEERPSSGLVQYEDANHMLMMSTTYEASRAALAQMVHFLRHFADHERGEVIHPFPPAD